VALPSAFEKLDDRWEGGIIFPQKLVAALEQAEDRSWDSASHPLLRSQQGDPVVASATDEHRTADSVEALPGIVLSTRLEQPARPDLMSWFVGEGIVREVLRRSSISAGLSAAQRASRRVSEIASIRRARSSAARS
jgi:hypothetical protein